MRRMKTWMMVVALGLAGCGGGGESKTEDVTPDPQIEPGGVPVQEVTASHIVIQFVGVERELPEITRRREEALQLATEVARRAAEGENFAALAREFSDGPLGHLGGYLGSFMTYEMPEAFARTLLSLEVGETSEPVLTEFGYHVIRREMKEVAAARHVLIAYAGADRAAETVTRSKDEARALAEEILAKAKEGISLERLAREYSDDASAAQGGDLGLFPRGSMAPAFDEATFASEPGDVVGVVETPFGFHVLQRYR